MLRLPGASDLTKGKAGNVEFIRVSCLLGKHAHIQWEAIL